MPPRQALPRDDRPRLVVQSIESSERPVQPFDQIFFSPDGALLAVVRGTVTLVEPTTGVVRGRFAGCARSAVFSADGRAMFILLCADAPEAVAETGRNRAIRRVVRWDLETDTATDLTSGPFMDLALSGDGRAIELTGWHGARSVDAASGKVILEYPEKPGAPPEGAPTMGPFFRADLYDAYSEVVDAAGNTRPSGPPESFAPDGIHTVTQSDIGVYGGVRKHRDDIHWGGVEWAPDSNAFAERGAIDHKLSPTSIFDATGNKLCDIPRPYADEIVWARDSKSVAILWHEDLVNRLSIWDVPHCSETSHFEAAHGIAAISPDLKTVIAGIGEEWQEVLSGIDTTSKASWPVLTNGQLWAWADSR